MKDKKPIEMENKKIKPKIPPEINKRARSITVGTCFGGIVEICMRNMKGEYVYAPLQPVEVIELVHQLSASIGCHIHVQPRADFGAWRDWKYTQEELLHFSGQNDARAVGFAPQPKILFENEKSAEETPLVMTGLAKLESGVDINSPRPTEKNGLNLNSKEENNFLINSTEKNKKNSKKNLPNKKGKE